MSGRVVLIPRFDEDGDPIAPQRMEPCAICDWNYSPERERDGVYRDVSPLFYYPHGIEVCRWCIARPTVRAAIARITAAKAAIEATL